MTSTQKTTVPQREPSPNPVAKEPQNDDNNDVTTTGGTGEALLQAMADAAQMSLPSADALTGMREEEEMIVRMRQEMTEYEEPEEAQKTAVEGEKGT